MIEALSKDATNKTAYYAGRCTGDVVITAVGGVEFVYGLITTISGGSGSAAALATGIPQLIKRRKKKKDENKK